jgi:hypothetical protein
LNPSLLSLLENELHQGKGLNKENGTQEQGNKDPAMEEICKRMESPRWQPLAPYKPAKINSEEIFK